jgi:hypothetical protein
MRLQGLLHSRDAIDHLGELGERREDARGRPQLAVSDEGARVETLEEELGGAEGEVLRRHEEVSVAVESVAEAQGAGRKRRLCATDAARTAHGHGHNGRSSGRVATEEELALARRGERADAARTQFFHSGLK